MTTVQEPLTVRWLSSDPPTTAARLAGVLGLPLAAGQGRPRVRLANVSIEIVAPEGRGPGLRAGEGLDVVTSPTRVGVAPDAGGDPSLGLRLVAVGVATVDAGRFADERGLSATPVSSDFVLGAFCSFVAGAVPLLLLEPSTEGPIAASLARLGEGAIALYLGRTAAIGRWDTELAAFRARGAVGRTGRGVFGREFSIRGWPAWGPHLIVCEFANPHAGTIAG